MNELIRDLADRLWGPPMLAVLSAAGIYFTFRLRGLQFRRLFESVRLT